MSTNNNIVMNTSNNSQFDVLTRKRNVKDERLHRKTRLTAAFRLFGQFGFDEGLAGHITARDPEHTDCFWVNPIGMSFKQMNINDLILVNHNGEVIEGDGLLNRAAFTIHAAVHSVRPDIVCAAHSHSLYGKAWASFGRLLDPITQDACAFYNDHSVFKDFNGVVVDNNEGDAIAQALGSNKAAILQNHGLITVGESVESAVWWYITMERSCQAQLLAEAAGTPILIAPDIAKATFDTIGSEFVGLASFTSLFNVISKKQPDMFQ